MTHPTLPHLAVVLAAGKGTRMRSDLAKVLHPVAGRPMIGWVLDAVGATFPARTMVVVGYQADQVRRVLPEWAESCLQAEQLGTGHAVSIALDALGEVAPEATLLVVAGDMPLITTGLLDRLLTSDPTSPLRLVTARVADTRGFGRVVRRPDGSVQGVVEEKDADAEIRAIREVNAGIYAFRVGPLRQDLAQLKADNAQGEYYLPDVIAMVTGRGEPVVAVEASEREVMGVNTVLQLGEAEAALLAEDGYSSL
jgi:bifunctional UDP-N-acetylglucosamine pyrophosphorylase/glucosamine-1-phosphate N-acetyltransferase